MKNLSESNLAHIMIQLLSAVNYLHNNKIIHKNIRPENILFLDEAEHASLKLIDLNQNSEKIQKILKQPQYSSPEFIKGQETNKCDIWSCGIILYQMLCGYLPFKGRKKEDLIIEICKGNIIIDGSEWERVSIGAKNFLCKMLTYLPTKRPSAEELLNDSWLKNKNRSQGLKISSDVMHNLKQFQKQQQLQQVTLNYFIEMLATQKQKQELMETFQSLDINKDGKLTKEELIAGYSKTMGQILAQEEVNQLFKQIDLDGNGTINYAGIQKCAYQLLEFVMSSIDKKQLLTDKNLETIFKQIDKDGSGNLDLKELKQLFSYTNIPLNSIKKIMEEFDLNKNNRVIQISFKEFQNMMLLNFQN